VCLVLLMGRTESRLGALPGCGRGAVRVGGDERFEPQRAERGDVVGDYREHRLDLTGGLVDRTKIGKWVAEHLLVGGQRQLDGIDGVVLIRGR